MTHQQPDARLDDVPYDALGTMVSVTNASLLAASDARKALEHAVWSSGTVAYGAQDGWTADQDAHRQRLIAMESATTAYRRGVLDAYKARPEYGKGIMVRMELPPLPTPLAALKAAWDDADQAALAATTVQESVRVAVHVANGLDPYDMALPLDPHLPDHDAEYLRLAEEAYRAVDALRDHARAAYHAHPDYVSMW